MKVVFTLVGWILVASAQAAAQQAVSPIGTCMREGAKLAGTAPLRVTKGVRSPKKIRDAKPRYPDLPRGTVGRGVLVGELLIAADGTVAHVWPIREPQFTPPFPAFSQAIVDAVRQWQFETLVVASKPTPVCLTTTVSIHWQ